MDLKSYVKKHILILHPQIGANLIAIRMLWSGYYGDIFNATMSMSRFSYLLSMLRLDNKETREEAKRYVSGGSGSGILIFAASAATLT